MSNDDKISYAMNVINDSQNHLWKLSHAIKKLDNSLGEKVFMETLQIELGLKRLNEALFGKDEYFESEK